MAGKPDPKKPEPQKGAVAKKAAEGEDVPEIEQVLFQGPLFGREANLKAHAKLVQAALVPVKQFVSDAMERRAHTIHLEPREGKFLLRYVIDGIPHQAGVMPGPRGMALLQMLKVLAGLDPADRSAAHFGGISAERDKVGFNLIVDTAPVGSAERLRIKIENRKVQRQRPQDVGLPEDIKKKIRNYTSERSGVVLVCGPPDSGTTTLSIVALHCVDPYLYQVYNFAELKGRELINVTDFRPEPGHDLEITFDRILRREADVLFMDPLVSPQDAQVIFQYGDRLSFIMEIPANTPFEALQKLQQWVGTDLIVKNLRGILTQKLIRKLCDDCKQAFRPNPALVKKLGLPPETTVLYRAPQPPPPDDPKAPAIAELCAPCAGVPYHGRAAIFEMLEMTDGMKEVVATNLNPEAVRRQMAADGQTTLQKDAIRLVAQGKTSLEEVQRVFSPPGAAKKKPAPRPPGPPR